MQRWFLSYHSSDHAVAERLKAAIEHKDSESHIFFAPTGMRAGGSWTVQLAQEIAQANAFILLIGERVGPWQVLEYDEALDKWAKAPSAFPLIVILLEGQTAPGLPFLRRLHWIVTPDPASDKEIARLFGAVSGTGSSPSELWRYTSPYRGLEAMEEKDSDYFFGRAGETIEVLSALACAPDRLPVLIGNSGVGKSSLAQAGVLAALKRQAWPEEAHAPSKWPAVFQDSRQWCFLSLKPGTDPLKALVGTFLDTWQFDATAPERATRQHGWMEALRSGKATLLDLIDATERRRELDQPKPPRFLLYIDQGEELYVRAEEVHRRRFSELLAQSLPDPRVHVMMSMRSDFLGHLQNDEPLFKARELIEVPPLREAAVREIVSRPAQLLSAQFEDPSLIDIISRRTAEDSVKDVGALPLLSYTLDDMWTHMLRRGDGTLRLPAQSFELGGVLVDRANKFLETHPGAEDALRRVLTLRLATLRDDGEPTRRRATRSEFADQEWHLVSELADYPNRLLVTATVEGGEAYAEVAHEAVFRRWDKLKQWIAAEREFLAWKTGLEAARRAWENAPDRSKSDALLMGFALTQALRKSATRRDDIARTDLGFIELSQKTTQRRKLRVQGLIGGLVAAVAAVLAAWHYDVDLKEFVYWLTDVRVLTAEAERALRPGGPPFKECSKCPEMVVVRPGEFIVGSPHDEKGHRKEESPHHKVVFGDRFAVAKFELTFEEWDACVDHGGCDPHINDEGWGRGRQPAINVTWDDARAYVAWLSRITGKTYRLLSEAEWEYAARAGSQTAYPWGEEIGNGNANCNGCGSQRNNEQAAPVGQFPANAFGLHDMHGNVWEWVEDCFHENYNQAPTDGSAWETGNCSNIGRVVRGGSWSYNPESLRSALRGRVTTVGRGNGLGFRVGRTLLPP
jgi:formylglycine-generating enzyme required for sulfatase activity